METLCGRVSQMWRTLPGRCFWIYLFWVNLEITGVVSDLCVYRATKHNRFTGRDDKVTTTDECQWGCCYTSDSPCCTAPISLIVGVVLGAVLIFSLVVAAVCCCCVCRKSGAATDRGGSGLQARDIQPSNQQSVVYHSETSGFVEVPNYVNYNDLPPSYEEVMHGETNRAFKPETS